MGIDWRFEPSINDYRLGDDVAGQSPVDRRGPLAGYDFYCLRAEGSEHSVPDRAAIEGVAGALQVLKYYPRSGNVLAVPAASAWTHSAND